MHELDYKDNWKRNSPAESTLSDIGIIWSRLVNNNPQGSAII